MLVQIIYLFMKMSLRGAVANVLSDDIIVSELEPQSSYYVHFWTKISLEKYEPPYFSSCGLNTSSSNYSTNQCISFHC